MSCFKYFGIFLIVGYAAIFGYFRIFLSTINTEMENNTKINRYGSTNKMGTLNG